MGRCGGSSVDIIEGTWWAGGGAISGVPNNSNPASVLNLSLGSLGSCDSYSQDVFDAINSWGVAVVSAAGNDGTNNAVSWPGDCDHVLDVAAHGHEDFLACYSNYGPTVDLVAPGGDIDFYGAQEAGIYTSSGPSSSSYSWPQGTSLAAPIVSGVVAQILALQPGWTLAQIQSHLQSHGRTAYCWNGGAPGWDNCSSDSGWAACPQAGLDAGAAMTALEGSSDDDSYEQNDSHSQAASVSCPSTINGQAEDDDWYSFQVNSGQDVEAELTWSGGADLDLALVDSSGEYEDVSDQGDTTSEQVSGSGLDGGSWYLLVAPYEGTASYSLSISCEEGSGDDDDNDDDDSGDDDDDGGGGGGGGRRRTACAAHGSPAHGASVLLLVLLALGCARLGTARSTNRRIF
jgi:serine protease